MSDASGNSIIQDKFDPWLVFLGATALHVARLAYYGWGESLVSAYTFSDAELYLHLAWMKAFVEFDGGTLGKIIPLSPYVLLQTTAYTLLGPGYATPHITNTLLASGSAVFMYLFIRNLFGRRAGVTGAVILIFSGPLLFYAGLTMKVVSTIFLLTGTLYFLETAIRTFGIRYLVWFSLFFAMLALERNNFLFAAPVIPLIAFSGSPDKKAIFIRLSALLLPGACLVFMFTLLFSGAHGTSPVSINFYIGNSHIASGAYVSVPGVRDDLIGQRIDVPRYAEKTLEKTLTGPQVQWFWIKKTLTDIAHNPGASMKLIGRKSLMMLSRDAPGSPEQYAVWRGQTPFFTVAVFDYALILALAVPGLITLWHHRRPPRIRLFIVLPLVYSLSVIAFFVYERYRFPVMLALIPFAAFTLSNLLFATDGMQKRLKTVLLVFAVYLTSSFLNAVNPQGPGWLQNPERVRASEERHRQANKSVYEHKRLALETGDSRHWMELSSIYHNRRMEEDSRLFADKAGEKSLDE